jgi:hypothetical protein
LLIEERRGVVGGRTRLADRHAHPGRRRRPVGSFCFALRLEQSGSREIVAPPAIKGKPTSNSVAARPTPVRGADTSRAARVLHRRRSGRSWRTVAGSPAFLLAKCTLLVASA